MSTIALLDGLEFTGFDQVQRGLAYGDGVFETMRVSAGGIALWPQHMARLAEGCARLGMESPADSLLSAERDCLGAELAEGVLKLLVWRDAKSWGYDAAGARAIHRCWTAASLPPPHSGPLRVRWCDLRLARQPRLAGIKSLNRLEQVLARAEWSGVDWDEGLLLDADGQVVGATAGNLFAVIDGCLVTPALDDCGIAGVFRGWMLAADASIGIRAILRADLERATEVFLTNAVRGVRPVACIEGQPVDVGPVTRAWIIRAQRAGLMSCTGLMP